MKEHERRWQSIVLDLVAGCDLDRIKGKAILRTGICARAPACALAALAFEHSGYRCARPRFFDRCKHKLYAICITVPVNLLAKDVNDASIIGARLPKNDSFN